MGADSLARNTPKAPEFVYPITKNPDFNKKGFIGRVSVVRGQSERAKS